MKPPTRVSPLQKAVRGAGPGPIPPGPGRGRSCAPVIPAIRDSGVTQGRGGAVARIHQIEGPAAHDTEEVRNGRNIARPPVCGGPGCTERIPLGQKYEKPHKGRWWPMCCSDRCRYRRSGAQKGVAPGPATMKLEDSRVVVGDLNRAPATTPFDDAPPLKDMPRAPVPKKEPPVKRDPEADRYLKAIAAARDILALDESTQTLVYVIKVTRTSVEIVFTGPG